MIVSRRVACLGLVLGTCLSGAGISLAGNVVQRTTFFNLADSVRGYLSLDLETGTPLVSPASNLAQSGTYWELLPVGRHRGYRAHMLISRSNSPYNAMFLAVDETTGGLKMSDDRESEATKWLVRYAGRFEGYDAYYLQLLGETDKGYDLSFLSVGPDGQVILQREPADAIHWRKTRSSALPAEVIR